ncbi:GntR family transcriptional regulator [Ensifer sp. T173]|uniref:GntR family transcriptional regulator n=1 Tax=Ensifer canadensis TaxID=555315 RepID=A0AAW4FHY7_9HYPH|nr:GntR family transcriptional regulator [Ensifer canadensis]UBI79250.1 GntR family transcriptional regulator [Ensifer canadensis]
MKSQRVRLSVVAQAVLEHALKPCTKQSEDTIADHFKVSRTSVRGAFVRLNAEGFVDLSADRSACVSDRGRSPSAFPANITSCLPN